MQDDLELLQRLAAAPELLDDAISAEGSSLSAQEQLRRKYPPELVRAALSLLDARRAAAAKFSRADQMWLDRVGAQQATSEAVALHKAQRFAKAGDDVLDLCSGIGADATALARAGLRVVAVDRSTVHGLRARLNAGVYGVADCVQTLVGEAQDQDVAGKLVHLDPDRRAGASRTMRVEDYEPGLEFMRHVIATARGGAIKLSPASNFGGKFPDCEVELVSLDGECKEATLWFGELRTPASARASILPAGFTLAGNPWDHRPRITPPGKFIYDPDPAIVRSGLLDCLVDKLKLGRLDDEEEYLTSTELIASPALAAFEVLADLPNNASQIRQYFREHPWGDVEIKHRHVPVEIEQLRKKLPLTGAGRITLFFARLQGRTRAVVARRV